MRLKSAIFVSAVIRQETSDGAFATILHKGAEDAGAVFIVHLKRDSTADLYSPAPQAFMDETMSADRWFEKTGVALSQEELSSNIERQIRFDPDCWIVELERTDTPRSIQILDTIR